MSEEQWLRDVLEASVPDPPATDRLAGIETRRLRSRRRATALAAATVGAVLALTIGLPVWLVGRGPDTPTATDPSGTTGTASVDPGCPPAAASGAAPDSIPANPVAVRLCAGAEGLPFLPPADLLVTDPARVAEAVEAQPLVDPDPATPCSADLGRGYALVFGYRDGSTAVATGELYGCRRLTVGSTTRDHPDEPWNTFLTLLRAQRESSSPPPNLDPGLPTCRAAYRLAPSPMGEPEEMVAGRFCARVGGRWVDVAIGEPDLRAIVADFTHARPMTNASVVCLDHRQWSIVGTTAWADLTRIESSCGWYTGKGPHAADAAPISPDVRRKVDRLLKQVTSR